MSGYEVAFYPDALKDLKRLDGSQRKHVFKAIERIRTNPLPQNEGGFGKPLGNKAGTDDWLHENQAQGKWHSDCVPPH